MKGTEHEPSDLPNQFIRGSQGGTPKQGIVIWNGTKGTLKYWAKEMRLSPQAMKFRSRLYMKGEITLEEMMGPRIPSWSGRKRKKPARPRAVTPRKPRLMPSGIPEVTSLL